MGIPTNKIKQFLLVLVIKFRQLVLKIFDKIMWCLLK